MISDYSNAWHQRYFLTCIKKTCLNVFLYCFKSFIKVLDIYIADKYEIIIKNTYYRVIAYLLKILVGKEL